MTAFHYFLVALAGACGIIVATFHRYYMPKNLPMDTEDVPTKPLRTSQSPEMAPPSPVAAPEYPDARVQPPVDKVHLFALAQQAFEGWYLPGSTHNGEYFPLGSPSFQRKNPGNIKQKNADGTTSFIVFPSEAAGLAALEAYIHRVIAGKHPAYPKGGSTTIQGYVRIYTADGEPAWTNYTLALSKAVNLPTTAPMSSLLS